MAGALVATLGQAAEDALPTSHEQAATHFARAAELVHAGDFARAAIEFELAYQLSPHFATLYNLGQAYVQLDKPVQAIDALERFLSGGGSRIPPKQRKLVEQQLEQQRQKVGLLSIRTEPARATLYLDDQVVPVEPGEAVALSAGTHRVRAEHSSYSSRSTEIELAAGQRLDLVLSLAELPAPKKPTGIVALACNVPSARVQIDGKPALSGSQHQARPGSSWSVELSSGLHEISFERSGYLTQRQKLQVLSAATHAVHCELRPRSDLSEHDAGTLQVRGEPGSMVFIDGIARRDARLPVGPHHVIAQRDRGAPSWETLVELSPGKTTTIFVPSTSDSAALEPSKLGLILGAAGLGVGAASLGVYLYNSSRFHDYQIEQAELNRLRFSGVDTGSRQAANDQQADSIRSLDNVAMGLAGASVGLVASGALLWFLYPRSDWTTANQASRAMPLGLRLDPRAAQVSWSGAW